MASWHKLNWTQRTKETNPHLPPCCHTHVWINRESPCAQVTSSEISWSGRSYSGFLCRNTAEDTRNTDFLRARASTTKLQGNDWLDFECAAIPTKIRGKTNIHWMKLIGKVMVSLQEPSFSHMLAYFFGFSDKFCIFLLYWAWFLNYWKTMKMRA